MYVVQSGGKLVFRIKSLVARLLHRYERKEASCVVFFFSRELLIRKSRICEYLTNFNKLMETPISHHSRWFNTVFIQSTCILENNLHLWMFVCDPWWNRIWSPALTLNEMTNKHNNSTEWILRETDHETRFTQIHNVSREQGRIYARAYARSSNKPNEEIYHIFLLYYGLSTTVKESKPQKTLSK